VALSLVLVSGTPASQELVETPEPRYLGAY
jgi:hypothetical protein